MDKIKYFKAHTIKILLGSSASASIVRKDVLYKRHKILKDKKNKWSTMVGTFNTTFVTETLLKLLELNHSAEIIKLRFNSGSFNIISVIKVILNVPSIVDHLFILSLRIYVRFM